MNAEWFTIVNGTDRIVRMRCDVAWMDVEVLARSFTGEWHSSCVRLAVQECWDLGNKFSTVNWERKREYEEQQRREEREKHPAPCPGTSIVNPVV